MDTGDPDAPLHKRPRLNSSVHPPPPPPPAPYNGLPLPQPTSLNSPYRHPAHPPVSLATHPQAHYPPHGLPAYPYPPPGAPSSLPLQDRSAISTPNPPRPIVVQQERPAGPSPYQPSHQPPSSLPPADPRSYPETTPRPAPSPHQRTHGFQVTIPRVPPAVDQDRISDYSRPPPTPQSTDAEVHPTPTDAKPQPVMERGGPAAPWPLTSDHTPNGSYASNGYPRVVNSPQHSEQPFHTPPLPPTQYAPLVPTYGTPSHAPYMGGSEAYANQVKRKHVRATQACNNCRSRKQKCDEARPCQFCRDNGMECLYKDVPPPKMDRSMMQLQDSMNGISETLKSFIAGMDAWKENFNVWKQTVDQKLLSAVEADRMTNPLSPEQVYGAGTAATNEHRGSRMPTPVQGRGYFHRVDNIKAESPVATVSTMSPPAGPVSTPGRQEISASFPRPSATPVDSANSRVSVVNTGDLDPTAFAQDHTTPAHQILQDWPTMRSFSRGIEVIENLKKKGKNVADYPMQLERFRGVVRVHGVGEGLDTCDGTQGFTAPERNGAMDTPSPPQVEMRAWGPIPPDSPRPLVDEVKMATEHDRGRRFDSRLLLDRATLERLFDSYCRHIHPLQPFLNIAQLKKMIRQFGDMYGPESRRNQSHTGSKRKRPADDFEDYSSSMGAYVRFDIHRSVHNAIVLLVLALGKVCEWKDPLPAPEADKFPVESQRWGYTRKSSRSASVNSSFNSEHEEMRERNMDRLPGMAYYSLGTDILGNLTGGISIGHAQANVLAALYAGQYARVLESWSWINNACRICSVLVKEEIPFIQRRIEFQRPDESKLAQSQTPIQTPGQHPNQTPTSNQPPTPGLSPSTQPEDREDKELSFQRNLIKLLYWTCLQLETDILAEMSTLPPSDISKYQDVIDYPKGVGEKQIQDFQKPYEQSPEDERVMVLYSSQIHLRVLLNHAHKTLYTNKNVQSLKTVAVAAREQFNMLNAWRKLQPEALRWNDNDPPASDINIARLRAKYYGAQYMVLRPYLEIALHEVSFPPNGATSDRSSYGSDAGLREVSTPMSVHSLGATPPETSTQGAGIVELPQEFTSIVEVARLCVQSAMESTIAFDRVGHQPNDTYDKYVDTPKGRLIVTNIFGTLHAQFGNMIVLAAVMSRKKKLKQLLPGDTSLTKQSFGKLLARTIKMLRQVGDNSPTLTTDADILENIQKLGFDK